MGKGREIIDLIHDARHLCTLSRISRLCFDSPRPLTFVLQDASGLMGGKSTAPPPPPPTIFLPQAMLGSLCHQFSFLSTWGPLCRLKKRERKYTLPWYRAVIKRRGPGISPGYYACGPRLFSWENRRKIEPNEIPSHFIPCLLVVFNQQLKILVTSVIIGSLCTATPPLKKSGRGNRSLFFWGE